MSKQRTRNPERWDTYIKKHPGAIVEVNDKVITTLGRLSSGEVRSRETHKMLARFNIVAISYDHDPILPQPQAWPTWNEVCTIRTWMHNPAGDPTNQMRCREEILTIDEAFDGTQELGYDTANYSGTSEGCQRHVYTAS